MDDVTAHKDSSVKHETPFHQQPRLEGHLRRIDRQINRLEALGGRFSWYRFAAIITGGLFVWLVGSQMGSDWGWRAFGAAVIGFFILLFFHRRVDKAFESMKVWRNVQSAHLARLNLDWTHLPQPPAVYAHRSPLDVDLDLTGEFSLHHLLDCSASIQGSRLLADWLSQAWADPGTIADRQRLVCALKPLRHFRNRLALAFNLAARERLDGDKLLGWLQADFQTKRLRWALPIAVVWSVINLGLFALDMLGNIPPFWTISLTFYLAFYYLNIRIFQETFASLVDLDGELGKFAQPLSLLERRRFQFGEDLSHLLAPIRDTALPPSRQLRNIRWITAGIGMRMNPIMGIILNLFLPWDYVFASLAARARARLQSELPEWVQIFYTLEAASSLANWADLHPQAAFPSVSLNSKPVFSTRAIGHPLISDQVKVRNDFQADEPGDIAIITGSNMAGKSTFIKAIGINLCMAYAGGAVDAHSLSCLPFHLYTVIRISDSISDGYSYFYAEVRRLKGLLELLEQGGHPVLYLVDEIFRGTNNRERLIGSRSTLRSLMTRNGVGLLATHDLELAALAEENPQVRNYHFRDDVHDGRLVFDYTIRPGPSPTTNALRIMAMEGLPIESFPL